MASLWFYYTLKPFVPWRVRMAMRRLAARRTRAKFASSWPIDEAAAKPPQDWPGWPEGKKFSFVLSHDVEGPLGVENCRALAELEMEMGVRSSFNFIPEGTYSVPDSLRSWLLQNGFEVGVHDLHHDGKLYRSREGFRRKSDRINHYLKEWGATGFRSGFMLRNLEWMHDLNIAYDASTFDTDPFEPMSNGEGTIFPFWIPSPACNGNGQASGYMELPYTLPQDSTLFLVLKETSPEVWLRKLDWVAANGGMALVNVHPDYMAFGQANGRTFPASYYRELLSHVSKRHAGTYWQPLPRDLATWAKSHRISKPSPPAALPFKGKRAAVLLFSQYPSDPRPRRAAEAMSEAGMEVDLLCLGGPEEKRHETISGVNVFRTRITRDRTSTFAYLVHYARFLVTSFFFLTRRCFSRRYDVVHVHNMPDFLVFAALVPKLQGARIILDLHDPVPELMVSIYGLQPTAWPVRLLRALERWSIRFSNLALTPNRSFKTLFVSRSCAPEKMGIVMNTPEERIFDPRRYDARTAAPRATFRVMHHGSILHRHGVDVLVEAVAKARASVPNIELHIYGSREPFLDTVLETAGRLGISNLVHYHGEKTQQEIAGAILECDLGVVPNRRNPFTEINFPTRLFEYLAMGRPVIAPDTQGIRDYFSADQIISFEPENVDDLTAKIIWVHRNPEKAQEFVTRGAEVYRQHLWHNEKVGFKSLVTQVLASPST